MVEGEVQQVLDALREAGSAAADIVEQCLPVLVAEARLGAIVTVVTSLVVAVLLGGAANILLRGVCALKARSKDAALSTGQRVDAEMCSGIGVFVFVCLVLLACGFVIAGLDHVGDIARPHMVVVEWLRHASP